MTKRALILAITLKRKNFFEKDRLVTVFSKELGRIRLLVKGARESKSKYVGLSEPFLELNVDVAEGRNFFYLTEAELVTEFFPKERDPSLINTAFMIGDALEKVVPEEEPNPEVYKILRSSLMELGRSKTLLPLFWFKWRLLFFAGLLPKLKESADKEVWLSPSEGGIVSEDVSRPADAFKISSKSLNLLKLFLIKEVSSFRKLVLPEGLKKEIEKTLDMFFWYYT